MMWDDAHLQIWRKHMRFKSDNFVRNVTCFLFISRFDQRFYYTALRFVSWRGRAGRGTGRQTRLVILGHQRKYQWKVCLMQDNDRMKSRNELMPSIDCVRHVQATTKTQFRSCVSVSGLTSHAGRSRFLDSLRFVAHVALKHFPLFELRQLLHSLGILNFLFV